MDINEDIPPFLSLPFDWLVLERWDHSLNETTTEQHIRLGIEFAQMGHQGRRWYVQQSDEWCQRKFDPGSKLPAPGSVPQHLLTDQERRVHKNLGPIWLRTDYSAGTDERHAELIQAYDDDIQIPLRSRNNVIDDPARYSLMDPSRSLAIYAFFPHLLLALDSAAYICWEDHYTSDEIQEDMFPSILPEKDTLARWQRAFFVADLEAMRTGFILWLQPDEFGRPLQLNRIQPWSLTLVAAFEHRGLLECRGSYEDGQLKDFGIISSEKVIGPWRPPVS